MKSIGVVRKVDSLGRIVLPKELRRILHIEIKDPLEFLVEDDRIILRSFKSLCFICGNKDDLKQIKHKSICLDCRKEVMASCYTETNLG